MHTGLVPFSRTGFHEDLVSERVLVILLKKDKPLSERGSSSHDVCAVYSFYAFQAPAL